jgi:hypothetical protein
MGRRPPAFHSLVFLTFAVFDKPPVLQDFRANSAPVESIGFATFPIANPVSPS